MPYTETFLTLQEHKKAGISQVEVYERVCSSLPFTYLKVLLVKIFRTGALNLLSTAKSWLTYFLYWRSVHTIGRSWKHVKGIPFCRVNRIRKGKEGAELHTIKLCRVPPYALAYRYIAWTAAPAPYSITVIVEPIGTFSFGWPYSKTSKAGTRTVTPSTERICHAIRATFVLFTEGICAAKTL